MNKYLLFLSVLGTSVAQISSAVETTTIKLSTSTDRSYSNNNHGAYVSSNDEISEAIKKLEKERIETVNRYEHTAVIVDKFITPDTFDEIKKWAEQGSAKYQSKLALRYEDGKGVKQDYKKALEWYQKAADQEYALSEAMLGFKYYLGEGVRQDYKKALEWLRKAVKHEDDPQAGAEAVLGAMYELGQGVRLNKKTAKEWYGKACDNGYQDGCSQYRILNLEGY